MTDGRIRVPDDLDTVTEFFLGLGFERVADASLEGAWLDKVVGLAGVRSELVTVQAPDGSGQLELTKYHQPTDDEGAVPAPANRLGLRHIAYVVEDLEATIGELRDKKVDLVGEVVNYQNTYRLCYVRGPEGLIIELAEVIGSEQA